MASSYHAKGAASTASPGAFPGFRPLSANFTQTPNQFFERVVGFYDPCVVSVVAILIRATLGWEDPDTGDRRVEADLPLSAFLRPKISEQSARRGLTAAIEAGFVVKTQAETPRTSARYALRWEDGEAQKRAITKQRAAQRAGLGRKAGRGRRAAAPKGEGRGTTMAPLGSHGERSHDERSHGGTPAHPYIKKSDSEKKESKDSEKSVPAAPTPSAFARDYHARHGRWPAGLEPKGGTAGE